MRTVPMPVLFEVKVPRSSTLGSTARAASIASYVGMNTAAPICCRLAMIQFAQPMAPHVTSPFKAKNWSYLGNRGIPIQGK